LSGRDIQYSCTLRRGDYRDEPEILLVNLRDVEGMAR
jgi:hypothetical protein